MASCFEYILKFGQYWDKHVRAGFNVGSLSVSNSPLPYDIKCLQISKLSANISQDAIEGSTLDVVPRTISEANVLLRMYPNPKKRLQEIYHQVVQAKSGDQTLHHYMHYSSENQSAVVHEPIWKTTLHLTWPDNMTIESIPARRKIIGERIAAALALKRIEDFGVLDRDGNPILYSEEELSQLVSQHVQPISISIPQPLQERMQDFITRYKVFSQTIVEKNSAPFSKQLEPVAKESILSCENFDVDDSIEQQDHVGNNVLPLGSTSNEQVLNIFTDEVLTEASQRDIERMSHDLYVELRRTRNSPDDRMRQIRENREDLPIAKYRQTIVDAIAGNHVIVLVGDTGCGKTTQVPQYIVEHSIEQMQGAACNVVITQPRRVSAISIARRVAYETGKSLGEHIGYQVRLDHVMPTREGATLFCTPGILLRKLQSNQDLKGVTHVIVDEVHERNVLTDFLLIILKETIQRNPELRLVLMSASINAEIFSRYFDNCPIVRVPGFMHPVEDHYLPDVHHMLRSGTHASAVTADSSMPEVHSGTPKLNCELVANVIKKICDDKPPGGILCFMPGWNEIAEVSSILGNMFDDPSHFLVIPAHSKIAQHKQNQMFARVPPNVRKIVLATNIAETSITINEIVYVIDPGIEKILKYDPDRGVSCLDVVWVSRASVQQRRGRAGRVQSGECFHLFPSEQLDRMHAYLTPEMHRIPLEQIVLEAKLHCEGKRANEFLSQALEPPEPKAVRRAVQVLQELDILDVEENLTVLGRRVAHFTTHPRLSKCLVYALLFRCLDPVLSIAAYLGQAKELFEQTMENKKEVKEIKCRFSLQSKSDHLTYVNLYGAWRDAYRQNQLAERTFCETNLLSRPNMRFMHGLRHLYLEHLFDAFLLESVESGNNLLDTNNDLSHCHTLIKGILLAGFYPNMARIKRGELHKGRIKHDAIVLSSLRDGVTRMHTDSVNKQEREHDSQWITYFNRVKSVQMGATMLRDTSTVQPLAVLMFGGHRLTVASPDEFNTSHSSDHLSQSKACTDEAVIMVDGDKRVAFSCSKREAEMLQDYRDALNSICTHILTTPTILQSADADGRDGDGEEDDSVREIRSLYEMIIKTTATLLDL
ncbi:PREDICTED: putative ATP-dependent RNA helicase DHX30 isoform X3 [Priapulus caudatus]|uniref:ATP-dependent RNA helicase DHX30 isoform X3 n=1 Tax=Priapulus caudatus TaxID=37621 RepID=A0ABM1E9F9_PRICU|nr:PREDICTED: putative ATP-dependent RNA helicase DHX30 isoform X3 [Priapulus caudatus]